MSMPKLWFILLGEEDVAHLPQELKEKETEVFDEEHCCMCGEPGVEWSDEKEPGEEQWFCGCCEKHFYTVRIGREVIK